VAQASGDSYGDWWGNVGNYMDNHTDSNKWDSQGDNTSWAPSRHLMEGAAGIQPCGQSNGQSYDTERPVNWLILTGDYSELYAHLGVAATLPVAMQPLVDRRYQQQNVTQQH